jgi:hypothetical protein
MLCICAPAGQEEFFLEIGVPVAARTTPPPELDGARKQSSRRRLERLLRNIGPSFCDAREHTHPLNFYEKGNSQRKLLTSIMSELLSSIWE